MGGSMGRPTGYSSFSQQSQYAQGFGGRSNLGMGMGYGLGHRMGQGTGPPGTATGHAGMGPGMSMGHPSMGPGMSMGAYRPPGFVRRPKPQTRKAANLSGACVHTYTPAPP